MFLLILLSAEADLVSKERYSKKNLVSALSFSDGRIILILLTEVIILYAGFAVVYVQKAGFQGLISRLLKGGGSSNL